MKQLLCPIKITTTTTTTIIIIIINLLFVSLFIFVCGGDDYPAPTVPFFLEGTVQPRGNYHIFVRTIPASEMLTILASYDQKISATEREIVEQNAAWMRHAVMPELRAKRFQVEHTFGVLGDTIVREEDIKFELKLDWKKAHDAYFKRKFDPIYVHIYTVDGPLETSLIERILINPSSETEYGFVYGTPREQQLQQTGSAQSSTNHSTNNFLLGHLSMSVPSTADGSEIVEKYSVKMNKIVNSTTPAVAAGAGGGVCQSEGGCQQVPEMGGQMVEIDTDGNFAIEFPPIDNIITTSSSNRRTAEAAATEEICLSFCKASKNERETKPVLKAKVFALEDPTLAIFGDLIQVKIDFLNGKLSAQEIGSPQFKMKPGKTWKLEGLIENFPRIDGYRVSKIEVKLFASNPLALSTSSSSVAQRLPAPLYSVAANASHARRSDFVFTINDIMSTHLNSVEIKQSRLYGLRSKSLRKPGPIYLVVSPVDVEKTTVETPILFQHTLAYPTLTKMAENNGEENMAQYRYKFVPNNDDDIAEMEHYTRQQIGMEQEKAKMVDLYHAYLKRTNKNLGTIGKIASQLDAFKLSLQMVHMKPVDSSK